MLLGNPNLVGEITRFLPNHISLFNILCVFSGNRNVDQVMHMLLGNPNLVGTLLAFFLDNTVPGRHIFYCKYCDFFPNFQKKKVMIFHENRLSADASHELSCLICYF